MLLPELLSFDSCRYSDSVVLRLAVGFATFNGALRLITISNITYVSHKQRSVSKLEMLCKRQKAEKQNKKQLGQ